MTTSESKGGFFLQNNRFESIRITNRIESRRNVFVSGGTYENVPTRLKVKVGLVPIRAFQFAIRIDSIRFVMRIGSNRFVL